MNELPILHLLLHNIHLTIAMKNMAVETGCFLHHNLLKFHLDLIQSPTITNELKYNVLTMMREALTLLVPIAQSNDFMKKKESVLNVWSEKELFGNNENWKKEVVVKHKLV